MSESSEVSLLSIPEELWGVIYSLLDGSSRRAFLTCCPAIRTAPSVLCHVTQLSIRAAQLEQCPDRAPLASLPPGIHLKKLFVEFSEESQLQKLFHPTDNIHLARVQDTISSLKELEIARAGRYDNKGLLTDSQLLGLWPRHLPLETLGLQGWALCNISPFLLSCSSSESLMMHTLKRFECSDALAKQEDEVDSSIIPALAVFKNLESLQLMACYKLHGASGMVVGIKNFFPLASLPALKSICVDPCDSELLSVLPQLPTLETLEIDCLPWECPPLKSASLEELYLVWQSDFSSLSAALAPGVHVPSLCSIQVEHLNLGDSLDMQFLSAEDVREEAIILAARCACLPDVAIVVENVGIYSTNDLDILCEVCTQFPRLGLGMQAFDFIGARFPPAKPRQLLPKCSNVTEIQVKNSLPGEGICSAEELAHAAAALGNLECVTLYPRTWDEALKITKEVMLPLYAEVAHMNRVKKHTVVLNLSYFAHSRIKIHPAQAELLELQMFCESAKRAQGRSCKVALQIDTM